jgi:molybdenum cofactor synthesis domain-containing protein
MHMLRCAVVTVSDRVSRGEAVDQSGSIAQGLLLGAGHIVESSVVVSDSPEQIAAEVTGAVQAGLDLVLLTGGTGLGPRDVTPQTVQPLLERELPGIAEAVRASSRSRVPTTDLSRMVFGTVASTFVACIPGSPGAVRDCLNVLIPLLPHAHHVLSGGDHRPGDLAPARTASSVERAEVTASLIDTDELVRLVSRDQSGAIATFAGVVRDHDGGRAVKSLHYEAHPSASSVLQAVTSEIAATAPVNAIAVAHRIGDIPIGEAALVVAVSAAHRGEAFAVCARLVDSIKENLPVWKHQVFSDGTDEWVNSA